jgi:branched-chain amino acid transport system permease protein
MLFVLLSLGLNIVVGFAGLLDLGYVAFYAVGAYVYACWHRPTSDCTCRSGSSCRSGAVACLFAGVMLGAPTLRLRGDYLAIVTLGFGEIVRIFMNNLSQPVNLTNGPKGITGSILPDRAAQLFQPASSRFGLAFSGPIKYYYFLLLVVLVVMSSTVASRTRASAAPGLPSARTRWRPRPMGINTRNIKLLAFAMGASFGGIAGGMFAAMQTSSARKVSSSTSPSWCSRWWCSAAWATSGA